MCFFCDFWGTSTCKLIMGIGEFFKNYRSDLDKLNIFREYRSNYFDIVYSQPLQIICVDVEAASINIIFL